MINFVAVLFVAFVFSSCSDSDGSSTSSIGEVHTRVAKLETIPTDWYVRLIAEDVNRGLKDESAQLGVLQDSDALTKHALVGYPPITPYLNVIFIDPLGVPEADYKTVFHTLKDSLSDKWTFTVTTDDPNANVRLTWRGLFVLKPYTDQQERVRYHENRSLTNPLITHMKLVDQQTLVEIPLMVDGVVQSYTFNMDGQTERTFTWVIQEDVVKAPAMARAPSRIVSETPQEKRARVKQQRAEAFDLSKPPISVERR